MKPEDDQTQKEDHDVLTHNMILPVGAMGIIGVVLITFLVFMAARWQDGSATDRSVRTAVAMLDQIHRDMARTTIDYGRFLRSESDRLAPLDLEWLDARIGHPITTTHGYGWIIIINGDDRFDYAIHDGQRVDIAPAAVLTPAIRRLIGLAREPRSEPIRAHSGLGKFQGEVQFVGVTKLSDSKTTSPFLMMPRAPDSIPCRDMNSTIVESKTSREWKASTGGISRDSEHPVADPASKTPTAAGPHRRSRALDDTVAAQSGHRRFVVADLGEYLAGVLTQDRSAVSNTARGLRQPHRRVGYRRRLG